MFFPTTGFTRDIYHDDISESVAGGYHPEDRIRQEDSLLSYFLFFLVGCMWAVAKKLTVYHIELHTLSVHTSFTPSSWRKCVCSFYIKHTHMHIPAYLKMSSMKSMMQTSSKKKKKMYSVYAVNSAFYFFLLLSECCWH